MRKIPFSGHNGSGDYFVVSDEDFEHVSERRSYLASSGYVMPAVHRFIMQPDFGLVVDHIDGDPLNNQRSNLRVCTPRENSWNNHARARRSTGVRPGRGDYWTASIQANGQVIELGQFTSRAQASAAYRTATIEHRGEFSPHWLCHFCVTTLDGLAGQNQARGARGASQGGDTSLDLCLWCSQPRHLSEDPSRRSADGERKAAA